MASNIDLVQVVFPTAVVHNVWNWIDTTEQRSKVAVFLVDFLDLHDSVISERCDHLFTCSFNNKRPQKLGHRAAYAGAGVCEVSSLLPSTWTSKSLLIGVLWSAGELADTAKICTEMAEVVFAKGSERRKFLIQIPVYSEPLSFLTMFTIVIVLFLFCIALGFTILACFLIQRSYTQKFIVLTSLNRAATNYAYFDYITKQIIAKCKDMHSVAEQLRPLGPKHKELPDYASTKEPKRPASRKIGILEADPYAGKGKERKQDNADTALTLLSSLPHMSNDVADNSAQHRRKTRQLRYRHNLGPRLAPTRQLSSLSLEKLRERALPHSNNYAVDNMTSEDQRKVCSFLPKQPNIIQTLDDNLRYLSSYPIEHISNLDTNYSYEVHKYNNANVLFSQIVMPIWASALIFSKTMKLQAMSDNRKADVAAIKGVFILVVDKIYDNRYVLPRELVGICAFNKNSKFHFCMITDLNNYMSLPDFLQGVRASVSRHGLTSESFSYNINLIHELLRLCRQRMRDRKEPASISKDDQAHQDSSTDLEPDLLNTSGTKHFVSPASSFVTAHPSKSPSTVSTKESSISVPSLKELKRMSSQELIDLLRPDIFTILNKPATRFITIIHALNAQHIRRSSGAAFLQLRSGQSLEAAGKCQQRQTDSAVDDKPDRTSSFSGSRRNKTLLYKLSPSHLQSKLRNSKNISETSEVTESSNDDRYSDNLPLTPLFDGLQGTKDSTDSSDPNNCDIVACLCHKLEQTADVKSGDTQLRAVPLDTVATQSVSQCISQSISRSSYTMLPPLPLKYSTSSTPSSTFTPCTDTQVYMEAHSSFMFGSCLVEDCALQEIYDALAYLGSSARERVARLLIKEIATRRHSLKDIQYFDKDCILISMDRVLTDSEMEVEIDIKLEPFSMLLRNINMIPRPVTAKTDCGNASSVDMYVRILLIYLELITLLDCTQSDLDELSIFLPELRGDADYGTAIQRLLLLIKDFSTIVSGERNDTSGGASGVGAGLTKADLWREYLLPIFT